MSTPEWRPVEGFDGYEISSDGRVRRGGRLLKIKLDRQGYHAASMWRDRRPHTRLIAPLVAAAFIGPKPAGEVVRHRNGVKSENTVGNLQYGTPAENAQDKRLHGTAPIGEQHPGAKLTEADVRAIRARYQRNSRTHGTKAIARELGVTGPLVSKIVRRELWKDVQP